ncbi:PadR family transcriptional regulator [Clostridium sp. WILCCON 0269]|uniref:PadR family transcriptional regulator n=1 Tax=Candidatus Clostridium eludens TaxID=3381663 RepID=A0ABW8SHX6_9CLOT
MQDQIMRKLFLGFIHIHILHHAKEEPFYGAWMIEELKEHGYEISAGTLYPILHTLEKNGVLKVEDKNVEGKIRKYYSITKFGEDVLKEAKSKAYELFKEIKD